MQGEMQSLLGFDAQAWTLARRASLVPGAVAETRGAPPVIGTQQQRGGGGGGATATTGNTHTRCRDEYYCYCVMSLLQSTTIIYHYHHVQ